jgi:hypothetical protein
VQRRVAKDDPRLVVTEHPRADGTTLVVAVNTHDKPVASPVKVAGKVGRVWKGKWGTREKGEGTMDEGVLSIDGNDGCIFEVTNGN